MASNVTINGVNYNSVPQVDIPKQGGGTASFMDTDDATLSSGGQMPSGVTAYAGGVKITGTAASNDSSDLTASGDTVTAPAGFYASSASKSVASGSVTVPSIINGTSAGVLTDTNTLTLSKTISVTPDVTTAGYISSGTAGNVLVALTASVTTKAATTYTPGTSAQTIASGTYLTGAQTISGDANLVAGNIVSGKTIFGVAGSATLPSITQDSVTKVLSIS